MNRILQVAVAGIIAAAHPAESLDAQTPRVLSLDATLGGGAGIGGNEVYRRGGIAVDALLGMRLRVAGRGALMAGLSAGFQGPVGSSDVCHFGSRGQCLDDFPSISPVAVLAGWEWRREDGVTLRVLAGPSHVRLDGDDTAGQRGRAAGGQGRVDVAMPPLGPVALVASLRGNLVPAFHGQTLGTWAAGVGIRLR